MNTKPILFTCDECKFEFTRTVLIYCACGARVCERCFYHAGHNLHDPDYSYPKVPPKK